MSEEQPKPPQSDIIREAPVKQAPGSAVVELPSRSPQELLRPAPQRGRGGRGGQRGGGRGGRPGRGGRGEPQEVQEESNLIEKVVHINRCAKVVKGGRRFSFAALVVVGDGAGNVGVGYGKAKEVPECIRKGTEQARRNMEPIQLKGDTIPHPSIGEKDGGRVMLRPATTGTGVIAGGGVRAVLEAAGVKNVLSKSLRSNNPGAVVFATLEALRSLRNADTINSLRQAE